MDHPITDEQGTHLALRVQIGEIAFDDLFHAYQKALEGFLRNRVQLNGVRDSATVLNLCQETWIKVLNAFTNKNFSPQPDSSFRGWLFTIARHELRNLARKRSPPNVSGLSDGDDVAFMDDWSASRSSDQEPSVEAVAIAHEFRSTIYSALQSLDPREFEIIRLLVDERLTLKECAELIGLSISRIHRIFQNTKAKIQALITEEFESSQNDSSSLLSAQVADAFEQLSNKSNGQTRPRYDTLNLLVMRLAHVWLPRRSPPRLSKAISVLEWTLDTVGLKINHPDPSFSLDPNNASVDQLLLRAEVLRLGVLTWAEREFTTSHLSPRSSSDDDDEMTRVMRTLVEGLEELDHYDLPRQLESLVSELERVPDQNGKSGRGRQLRESARTMLDNHFTGDTHRRDFLSMICTIERFLGRIRKTPTLGQVYDA